MLVVGERASGKTTLIQQTAAKFHTSVNAASLLYVGPAADVEKMRARVPPDSLLRLPKKEMTTRDVLDELIAQSAVAALGFTTSEATEREALNMTRAALRYVIERRGELTGDAPLILALDGLEQFAPRGGQLSELLTLFQDALSVGEGFVLLASFEGFYLIEQLFGARGLSLFARLGDIALLRNRADERANGLAEFFGAGDLRALPTGGALLISHAWLEFPNE
jgi:hypothetical protein